MRVAVIDNYDSFVYNLVQYIGELGCEPMVFRNDARIEEIKEENPDKILISPGPKTPEEAGISPKVVSELGKETPTLGVCLGHQAVIHAFGGEIFPAEELMHGKTSMIEHDGKQLYEKIPNPFEATRYHSLVVKRSSLPDCLEITAWTEGNHQEIMGVRHEDYPISGVQFHPESILTSHGMQIVKNFLTG